LTAHASSQPELAPPLKWAGGKRWLVPRLAAVWRRHAHRRLVEPFVGGAAVALGLRPRAALLNDSNPHLVNFYRQLQRGLVIALTMANDPRLYYEHRARFNRLVADGAADTAEAAALFDYLNRTCYNGLCRFNRGGGFNVPFGRHKSINYARDFGAYRPALAGWQFTAGDFAALELGATDFVYADPPYDVEFTAYSPGGFAWADQVRLAEWLAAHAGPVVASNQATPKIVALYERLGFKLELIAAPRMIACNGDRTPAGEMLASKNI
jgi:DNA adenine methylase